MIIRLIILLLKSLRCNLFKMTLNNKRKAFLLRQTQICYLCGEKFLNDKQISIDHMIAKSKRKQFHNLFKSINESIKFIKYANYNPVHIRCNVIKANGSILAAVKEINLIKKHHKDFKQFVNRN